MTNYEMLQTLLNDSDLQDSIVNELECGRSEIILSEYEPDKFLLDVKIFFVFNGAEILMHTAAFEFDLSNFGSIESFFIRTADRLTVKDALESAKLGEIIEDFLRSRLN